MKLMAARFWPTCCTTCTGIVRLLRLSNSLPASGLVLIGAWLVAGWPLPWQAWQAAAAMWCVTAFGYASNDYFDIREDRRFVTAFAGYFIEDGSQLVAGLNVTVHIISKEQHVTLLLIAEIFGSGGSRHANQ